MATKTVNEADQANRGGLRWRLLAIGTTVGIFGSLSAIASNEPGPELGGEDPIAHHIVSVENQEEVIETASRLDGLVTPRIGTSWRRATFTMASNPVLLSRSHGAFTDENPRISFEIEGLSMIEDAVAAYVPITGFAPEEAEAPKRRGQAQWQCLAEAIYFEARSEDRRAQRAVAEVILNRVDSKRYPDTVCQVIQQGAHRKHRCQFSYNCDGLPENIAEPKAWAIAKEIALDMVHSDERLLTLGATHYHATSVRPSWSRKLTRTAKYGSHIFYREGTKISRR